MKVTYKYSNGCTTRRKNCTAWLDIDIPEGTQFYIVPENGWGKEHPFSGEKMSVIMALYKADNIDHAIELTNNIQAYQGQGHSCGIYSNSDDNIMRLANATKTSRVMVNQPQAASNSGNLWNGMRQTFSLRLWFMGWKWNK